MHAHSTKLAAALAASSLILASSFGCGDGSGRVPVGGRVTYNGGPVTKGEVYFSPEAGGKQGAQGPIDSSGYYKLGTLAPGDGAHPGKYKVSVISKGPDKPMSPKMVGKVMPDDMHGSGDALVPKKYFSPETSGLTTEVPGKSSYDFDLVD